MAILVTYDIASDHVAFKQRMFQLGYADQIPDNNCGIIYFPNTTLYHNTKDAVEARTDVRQVASQVGTTLERCVATIWSGWAAICGEPFRQ